MPENWAEQMAHERSAAAKSMAKKLIAKFPLECPYNTMWPSIIAGMEREIALRFEELLTELEPSRLRGEVAKLQEQVAIKEKENTALAARDYHQSLRMATLRQLISEAENCIERLKEQTK